MAMRSRIRTFAAAVASLLVLVACPAAYSNDAGSPTGSSVQPGADSPGAAAVPDADTVVIPGPLRSFLRMAGISQKASPDEVLPLLARNVNLEGYQVGSETEFLLLLDRYLHQARELQHLASPTGTITIAKCEDAGTLLEILGYRLRQGCGQKGLSLVTASPGRAFLTIDSGFPLTDLEEALQKDTPFTYSYPDSKVPVLFKESDWMTLGAGRRRTTGNLVDVLLHDPGIARLYWGLSKSDAETQLALRRSPGLKRLLPYGAVLDFYGSEICVHDGRVNVPGGPGAEQAWKDLVGASPESSGDFVGRLLAKDHGWLAAYFDVVSRVSQGQQTHLTQTPRLRRLYEALRTSDPESSATKGVFRNAPDLLVLFTRVRWEENGDPLVPGDLDVWKGLLSQKSSVKEFHESIKHSRSWNTPEQLLEVMVGLSRTQTDSGLLQLYLMLSEIDGARTPDKRLSPGTVRLLAGKFPLFGNWYTLFCEFPELSDGSIANFVTTANAVDAISNEALRGNAIGAYQANIGLWQILARQGEIPAAKLNASWQSVVVPFASIASSIQLFDAAHSSLSELLTTACGKANCSQDEIIEFLAGPPQESADGQRMHQEMVGRIRSVLEDQHLVSLDTLFSLSDGLNAMAGGAAVGDRLLPLAGSLREFELPRPIFTKSEKVDWAPLVYRSRHAELQIRLDLTKVIKGPGSPAQLKAARGQLAPFLRDTLVGLNYAYYEPLGAQILHNDPLFVRSHDFMGLTFASADPQPWSTPRLFGVGTPAGGGAYLIGSLADLPYALASTEQDFIVPENVQALIWRELVPDLLLSATLPRWWSISPKELHAVTLYQRAGEELMTASESNPKLREKVTAILADRMAPKLLQMAEDSRYDGPPAKLPRMMPADAFYLAAEFRTRFPGDAAASGPENQALDNLCRQDPSETNRERLSRDFGVPHPTLTRSYARELLNVKPFPAFGGFSSRLFGESWESSNLYWSRLVDEMGYSPVMLNRLVPELTRHMIVKIFATDIEDWQALLRAMQETGEDFRRGKVTSLQVADSGSQR